MGLQPFLAADAGLPKDAREQVNGDVVMMGIGDGLHAIILEHVGMAPPLVGAVPAELSEAPNKFRMRNGSKAHGDRLGVRSAGAKTLTP